MEKHIEKNHKEEVAEIDERIEKMAKRMADEGYKFELTIPDESTVVLKIAGREFNFTKKSTYDTQDKNGKPTPLGPIEDVIESEIRKLGE